MKNKTLAGLLALFFGALGIHRFYLGQTGLGILYIFLIGISFILGIIDAIYFFNMDEDEFNRKYNSKEEVNPLDRRSQHYTRANTQRGKTPTHKSAVSGRDTQNPYKINGIKKYKEFDLEGAIADFKKGLEIHPKDISLHFNIACAYSLTEQVEKAYAHLDKAVSLGFNDFERIKTHDDLAYVRIQDQFDDFLKNGFRLQPVSVVESLASNEKANEEPIQDDLLLSQLRRLSELRDRGLLSDQEFIIEKKKLTR